MDNSKKKALLIYLEPTPYILALLVNINNRWSAGMDVLFVGENLSQDWGVTLDIPYITILPGGFREASGAVRSRLATDEYAVMHLAGWGHPVLLASMILAWFRRVPITVESDTPLPIGLPAWKRAVKRIFYPLLFSLPSNFLPGGIRQAEYLRHYGVKSERILVAQMTVDVTAISRHVDAIEPSRYGQIRQTLGISEDATVFLYVGRMEPHKGVLELIESFLQLSVVEDKPAVLLLIGDGSLSDVITQKLVNNSGVYYPGRLSGSALLDAYAASDVFVIASRFEPWGLVVNEAMAAGLPVIASDRVGCVEDLVIDGVTGLVVPAESNQALADAMQRLLVDVKLSAKLASNAHDLIAEWTLENEADIIVNAWGCLLNDETL